MGAVISPRAAGMTATEREDLLQECCTAQLVVLRKVGSLDDGDGPVCPLVSMPSCGSTR